MIGYRPEVLARARAAALTRMTERVTVGLAVDGVDNATGDATVTIASPRYQGVGEIEYPSLATSAADGPSQPLKSQSPVLKVPHTSPVLRKGDTVRCDASTSDPSLVTRTFVIDGHPQSGKTSSHRYPLVEL